MVKSKLIIVGASGHGKVVADIAIKMNKWRKIAFLDDDESIKILMGLEVIGKTSDAFNYKHEDVVFVAIGNNYTREKIQDKLTVEGVSVVKLIHPNAIIGNSVEIGNGTVVMAGAVINSESRIGKGCIINTSSSVDHDSIIEDYVHVSPGVRIAGGVSVGERTWLGIGSVVSNNVKICSDCKIGAGAVVVKDIIESGTYIGVPARRVDR